MGDVRRSRGEKGEEPISEYCREVLFPRWVGEGKTLKGLGRVMGLGDRSTLPSQIGSGAFDVTNYSGPKIAHAFGMTYPELVAEAYEWWGRRRKGDTERRVAEERAALQAQIEELRARDAELAKRGTPPKRHQSGAIVAIRGKRGKS